MNYIQYMKPGGNFDSSQWDFNKVDKSKLTPEQINYAVEQYFWRTKDPEMKKQYELWSNYQQNANASQKADPISDIAAASELPEVTITLAKPNYIDQIKSDVRNKWANMSTEDKLHAGIDAATIVGGFIPGADVVTDGVDILHSLQRKDWAGAGIGTAAMMLPFVSAPMLRKIKNAASNTLFSPEARLARAMNKNIRSAKFTNTPIYHGSTFTGPSAQFNGRTAEEVGLHFADSKFPGNYRLRVKEMPKGSNMREGILTYTQYNQPLQINDRGIFDLTSFNQDFVQNPDLKKIFNTEDIAYLKNLGYTDDAEIAQLLLKESGRDLIYQNATEINPGWSYLTASPSKLHLNHYAPFLQTGKTTPTKISLDFFEGRPTRVGSFFYKSGGSIHIKKSDVKPANYLNFFNKNVIK